MTMFDGHSIALIDLVLNDRTFGWRIIGLVGRVGLLWTVTGIGNRGFIGGLVVGLWPCPRSRFGRGLVVVTLLLLLLSDANNIGTFFPRTFFFSFLLSSLSFR